MRGPFCWVRERSVVRESKKQIDKQHRLAAGCMHMHFAWWRPQDRYKRVAECVPTPDQSHTINVACSWTVVVPGM